MINLGERMSAKRHVEQLLTRKDKFDAMLDAEAEMQNPKNAKRYGALAVNRLVGLGKGNLVEVGTWTDGNPTSQAKNMRLQEGDIPVSIEVIGDAGAILELHRLTAKNLSADPATTQRKPVVAFEQPQATPQMAPYPSYNPVVPVYPENLPRHERLS